MIPYQLTDEAKADLFHAINYIAGDSLRASERWEAKMLETFQHLARWLQSGKIRTDYTIHELKFWIEGRYLILYDPYALPLTILAIFHGAQDIARLMSERFETDDL